MSDHFGNKDPLKHVLEKRIEGSLTIGEAHGIEIPHPISQAAESAKESALLFLLLSPLQLSLHYLFCFFVALLLWKGGRAAWIGWSRLERYHQLIEQERF